MDCIFCSIIAGEAEASVVYDDANVLAFMDIRPFTSGHLLVVPKRHASGFSTLDPDDGARIFAVAQKIAAAMRTGPLPVDGVNLHLSDGAVAGQEVFHVHLHVIPRNRGGRLRPARPTSHAQSDNPRQHGCRHSEAH